METDDDDFDPDVLFPAEKYVKVPGVWVFEEHSRADKSNKPKNVTADRLEKMATTNNRQFSTKGVATALIIGHTKDDADEKDQPGPVGWAVRYRVDPLLKTGKAGLKTDWYVKRRFEHVIEEFPHRSIELWPDDRITHIALLKTAGDRELPIIKYEDDNQPYRYTLSYPISTNETDAMNDDVKDKVDQAKVGESSPVKELQAEVAQLKEMLAEIMPTVMQLKELMEQTPDGDGDQDGGDDLLQPADKGKDAKKDTAKEKPAPKKQPAGDAEPAKFAFAGPANVSTPTTEPEKKVTKMSRVDATETENAEVVRYKKALAEVQAQNADFALKFNRMKAEKKVAELEQTGIDFGKPEEREEEIELFARLDDRSFDVHADKVVRKYKRKPEPKPDSEGVATAMKYGRTGEPKVAFKSEDDIVEFQNRMLSGETYEDIIKSKTGK